MIPGSITTKPKYALFGILSLVLLLSGFFWDEPTWEGIEASIDKEYPTVANMDVDRLKASLDAGRSPVLLDVREEEEFAVSHLPGAVNITKTKAVSFAKDTAIVVYCSVGVRSAAFARELGDQGYTRVSNLRGSIFAWGNKGYPLQRGEKNVRMVHPYDKKWGTLLNRDLHSYQPE